VKNDSDRDYYMTAAEAKAYGLVDHVVESRKEVKPPEALKSESAPADSGKAEGEGKSKE